MPLAIGALGLAFAPRLDLLWIIVASIGSGWRTVLIMLAVLAVAQTAIGIIIGRNTEAGR
ncbi:hypothetical protein [Bifidobacterium stellenboschense]|uniref:hypothetical protein n=1 Tax=Bifidobacterium stellenboschense TaxID=762211 RepID=UPI0005597228|nr:hypothetical protein [Bifidobacterium stellenboschense]